MVIIDADDATADPDNTDGYGLTRSMITKTSSHLCSGRRKIPPILSDKKYFEMDSKFVLNRCSKAYIVLLVIAASRCI